ncbi:MAG: hypothetical protein HN617_10245 [Planctomycetaceae bacterium]|jgi:hypothetical protein|nr:hypothetical protein [Planctomycetaceae bacterium]MBT4011148.1 hypothetical protein [Planctomycetaceae bacterium]MBT4725089.1 hypothetical protein [Planctomycetaceae bacterium]MBT5124059.1 hypothetical protein [Planctomycetaceae bacterium]MBT5597600.1 hypothetical protein [Planctomycetaceae bacterium]
MIKIREFLNTDPPALAEVINRCCNIESVVSAALLEHAVFSKICFTHDRLLIATEAQRIVGFVHLGSPASDQPDSSTLTISNLLFDEDDFATAIVLVEAASRFARDKGFSRLRIGSAPENAEYYNGISSHFLNVGIPDFQHVLPALYRLGFKELTAWVCYQCDPTTVKIPFRREHMLYRRSHDVVQVIDPIFDSSKINLVFSHLANSELRLIARDSNLVIANLAYASLAHSYPGWPNGGVDVLSYIPNCDDTEIGVFEYLVCELIRQLPDTGLSPLRVHVSETDILHCKILLGLGFDKLIRSVHIGLDLE